ncbi:hypothetical protein ACJIZ3_019056 [Penstemon smallii]|uniref:Uncharacterized protein n=1 Tax=Penstemon smallii TaxID=265156 RepID=A0ABD3T047_9LAMI
MDFKPVFEWTKFDGNHVESWQNRIQFHLHLLNLDHMLLKDSLQIEENDSETRKREDLLCRGEILNSMVDTLFDFFVAYKTAHELWIAIGNIYMSKDVTPSPIRKKEHPCIISHLGCNSDYTTLTFHGEKLKGHDNYRRWKNKMLFHLAEVKFDHYLYGGPSVCENASEEKRKKEDWLCKHVILFAMENVMYRLYSHYKTAKELWDALEKQNNFNHLPLLVSQYMGFEFVEEKPKLEQIYKMQVLVHRMEETGVNISESFQVAAVFCKLSRASWQEFKWDFESEVHQMKLEDLMALIRVEEEKKLKVFRVEEEKKGKKRVGGKRRWKQSKKVKFV